MDKFKRLNIILLLSVFSLALTACSDQEMSFPSSDEGQLRIVYRIAGVAATRAETEPGWNDDWHENDITRLDLFVFEQGGTLYKPIHIPDLTVEDAQNDTYTLLGTDELTYADVTSNAYTYYMVANCPQLGTATIENLNDLQEAMITQGLNFDQLPLAPFVMDGKGTLALDENIATLTFDLSRAAAKIRLTVNDNDGKNITNDCTYQFVNYVSTGTSVLAESEAYGEGEGQQLQTAEIENPLTYEDADKGMQAVFYSYPNDWFDESLLKDDGTFEDEDIYAKDDLIDEMRQTYILLTYDKNQFKVPVNFAVSQDNDKVSFTAEEIETLRDTYYCIKRNYIYDVTVTIDMETIKITTWEILVVPWYEHEIEVPPFT